VDYIFRWLGLKFLRADDDQIDTTLSEKAEQAVKKVLDASGAAQIPLPNLGSPADRAPKSASPAPRATSWVRPALPEGTGTPTRAVPVGFALDLGNPVDRVIDEKAIFRAQADAPPCHVCGSITVRAGACYACPNCGATSGCS